MRRRARRGAVETTDDRFFQLKQAVDYPLGVVSDAPEQIGVVDHRLEPSHIAAGTEGTAGSGQDDQVAFLVLLYFVEDAGQFLVHREVNRVQSTVLDGDAKLTPAKLETQPLVTSKIPFRSSFALIGHFHGGYDPFLSSKTKL